MKILVAGAGIAGSVFTRMARERGHEVVLTDAQPHRAASRCAYAYLRTAWFKGDDKRRVREALDWYETRGWLITRQADVWDARPGRPFRTQDDHVLISPRGPLVKADGSWEVTGYREDPGGVVTSLGSEGLAVAASHLVLACGAGMTSYTYGTPSYGGVFECDTYPLARPLKVYRITDRLSHVVAYDGSVTRTAASKGRTPEEARARSEKILELMMDRGMVTATRRWTYRPGARWSWFDGSPAALPLSPHVWALTGFARNGYALVPSYARNLLDKLEEA